MRVEYSDNGPAAVNLPKASKMSPPRYQSIAKEQIPVAQLGPAGYARVIAGELNGVKGPAKTFTAINVLDVRLKGKSQTELRLPSGHNTALVLLNGEVQVGAESLKGEAQIAVLSADGERVPLDVKEDSTLLVLSGEPINEPVASYGPFVMNTRQELLQAMRRLRCLWKMGHLQ